MMNVKLSRGLSGGPLYFSNQFYIDLALQKEDKRKKKQIKRKKTAIQKRFQYILPCTRAVQKE